MNDSNIADWPTVTIDLNGTEMNVGRLIWIWQQLCLASEQYDTKFFNVLVRRMHVSEPNKLAFNQIPEVITPPVTVDDVNAMIRGELTTKEPE